MKLARLTVALLIVLTCVPTVAAQNRPADLRFRNMERLIGTWQAEEEVRQGPDQPWVEGSSGWEIEWMPGRYTAQISGQMNIGGVETSWIQVWGYDPVEGCLVSWHTDSQGSLGQTTSSAWKDTTFLANWTDRTVDGDTLTGRCTWAHSADFRSIDGTCEVFGDGGWWTFRRVKARRSD